MKEFDFLLIYYQGRAQAYFLNIIKHLFEDYRVGLLLSDEPDFYETHRSHAKVKETEEKFCTLCELFGAQKVYVSETIKTKVIFIPSFPFCSDYFIQQFKKNITWQKSMGVFFFLGRTRGFELFRELGVTKFYSSAKYIFETRARHDGTYDEIKNLNLIETGFPYKQYPVFKELDKHQIDYLIAYPSPNHFRGNNSKAKYDFSKNVYSLLKQINNYGGVYYKHHNVRDKQRTFESRFFRKLPRNITILKLFIAVAELCITIMPFKKKLFYTVATQCIHKIITEKCTSLEELTEYHNLAIEVFLPHVKKGLITGISATVFQALNNKLPVYNCDPREETDGTTAYNKNYQIPCCHGALVFDESLFSRISNECRNSDIIQLLLNEHNQTQ